jgi:adenine-specific DNA-methyltransferase
MRVETIGDATLYLGDCLEILPTLPKVDAVITDPPYYKVKGDYWDNEWDTPEKFLEWMALVVDAIASRLHPNGSLYLFASPQMAARVETLIRQKLAVLANITWNKGARRKGAAGSGVDVTALRTYWQAASERVIFAEPYGSDEHADGQAGYTTACENTKRSIFGDYLRAEFDRAGVTNRAIAALFPSASGGLTGCVSNWLIGYNCPTAEQYQKMRDFLNGTGGEYLRREYEELRREYEELRREYEELRRPFNINEHDQWGDVWEFDPPAPYPGKHPCEKPLTLLRHVLKASTRPGAVVLDAFVGSGSTGHAAITMGRKFIGIERDEAHFNEACQRIENAQRQERLFA